MKRIILFLSLILSLVLSFNVQGFNIDSEMESLNIYSKTLTFTIDFEVDEVVYDHDILYTNDNKTFVIVTPTSTRLLINPNGEQKIINLNFVTPQAYEVSLKLIDNNYYVFYNNDILYGDFNFIADGKEVTSLYVSGNNVSLIYDNTTITNQINNHISDMTYYIVLGVGLSLVLIIIVYLVYLLSPKNYTKKFNKAVINLRKTLEKNKKPQKIIFIIKLKLVNINNLFKSLDKEHPVYLDIKKNLNELNLILDNINKLDNFIEVIDLEKLRIRFITLLNNINNIVSNNDINIYKTNFKSNKVTNNPNKINKSISEDAYRYLEGSDLIKK